MKLMRAKGGWWSRSSGGRVWRSSALLSAEVLANFTMRLSVISMRSCSSAYAM
jgi:hypothetical protein